MKLDNCLKKQEELTKILREHNILLSRNLSNISLASVRFPIKSDDELKSLEDDLMGDNRENLVISMRRLLCDDLARNLERIFDPNLLSQYNYDGTKGKKAIKLHSNLTTALKGRNISKCECEDTRKTVEELKGTIEQREKVISGQMKLLMEAHAEQKVLLNKLLRQKKDSLQIYDKFPVRSVENLIELDGEITTETKHVYVKAMNSILKPAGVQKNLKYIITNNVMMEFNIDGNQGKQSFKKLENFYSTLLESIPITTDSGPAEEQLRKAIQLQKKREIKSKCLKNKK